MAVVVGLHLVSVTAIDGLAEGVHRVLVGERENSGAVGVGAAGKSGSLHILLNAGARPAIPFLLSGSVGREGIEPPQPRAADLQSAELTTLLNLPRKRGDALILVVSQAADHPLRMA